jgi:ketosteroid isomerase-like protein
MIGAIIARILIRKAFRDLNKRNLDSFLSSWSDDAVFYYPGTSIASGSFTGKTKIKAWFSRMLQQFPEIDFNVKSVCVKNIMDVTGNNFVIADWDLRIRRTDGKEFKNSGVTTVILRFGKAKEVRDFIFDLDRSKESWSLASTDLDLSE